MNLESLELLEMLRYNQHTTFLKGAHWITLNKYKLPSNLSSFKIANPLMSVYRMSKTQFIVNKIINFRVQKINKIFSKINLHR